MENPLTQEWKCSPPIPHPFDELELIDKTFNLPIGMDEREPGDNSLLVSLQALDKALDFSDITFGDLLLPLIETLTFSLAHELPKVLNECV